MAIGVPAELVRNTVASASTVTLTIPVGGVAAGTDILIAARCDAGGGLTDVISSVSDNASGAGSANSWSVDKTSTRTTHATCSIARCHVTKALNAGDVITVTFTTNTSTGKWCIAYTVTGLSSAAVDQTGAANANSAAPSVSTGGATTQADELVFGAFVSSAITPTSGTEVTAAASPYFLDVLYIIASSTGTKTLGGTMSSGQWTGALTTYKGSGGTHYGPFAGQLAMVGDIVDEFGVRGGTVDDAALLVASIL